MAEPDFHIAVKNVAKKLQPDMIMHQFVFKKYDITIVPLNRNDSGVTEMFKATILIKNTKKNIELVLKKAPKNEAQRELFLTESSFKSEIYFYAKAYVSMKKFEKQHRVLKSFIPVAEYVTFNSELGNELIVLEDLNHKDFEMKRSKLDEDHCRLVFKTYGQFHAISFCLKYQNPEQFRSLVIPSEDILNEEDSTDQIIHCLQATIKQILDMLKQCKQNHLIRKLQPYLKNAKKLFLNSVKYEGDNRCFLHGDSKSTNMMFKYNAETNQVEAVKLLNFHNTRFGSPVHDLSTFFYREISETNQHLDSLNSFLDSYYESFSTTVRMFNQDPEQLFPKYLLQEHWKKFAKSSALLALILLKSERSFENEQVPAQNTRSHKINNSQSSNSIIFAMLQHLYDNNAL